MKIRNYLKFKTEQMKVTVHFSCQDIQNHVFLWRHALEWSKNKNILDLSNVYSNEKVNF